MAEDVLSVREIQISDIENIVRYWLNSDHAFLQSMGVDLNKVPSREKLMSALSEQLELPLQQKRSYCIIWELNKIPIGHSNTNPTVFGIEGYMHLHIWDKTIRKRGLGLRFVNMTLPYFFNNLKLKMLFSEPYALNPPPNKTLEKAGFDLLKEYITVPGWLNFEQPVKRWALSYEKFKQITKDNGT